MFFTAIFQSYHIVNPLSPSVYSIHKETHQCLS